MKYRDQYVPYKLKVTKGCFDKISDLNDKRTAYKFFI